MVEVKVETKEKNHVEITFVDDDLAMAKAIREELLQDSDVEFAGVVKEHPEVGHPKLVIRTKKGNPLKLVAKAAEKVAAAAKALAKQMK